MSDKDEPWTADDIRKNAANWSLYCDGKLLEYMKGLSKTIEERGNRTNYNMQNSMLALDRTKINLENATNQLMALQHKQFVENRVYDDDETLANVDNVPTVEKEETDEPELSAIDALRNAVETGIQTMYKYYDKVTYELSDSEDDGEEVEKSVIFRPKNLYKHRPLPYLIGSKEWQEKWHIGLVEEDSEESDKENVEEETSSSSSPSPSPGVSMSSNVPVSLSESENPTGVIPSRKSDAQDLFESSSEENVSRLPHETMDNNSTLRRQSHETPKTEQITKQSDSREINTSNSIFMPQKQPISHVIPSLIDSNPPELDEAPSIRNAPKKPPNLFLDDEDDQDDFNIFDDKTTKSDKTSHAQHDREKTLIATSSGSKITTIDLFADDENDNFDFLASASARPAYQKPEIKNLFDDDDDDELFLQPSEPSKSVPRTTILSNEPKKDTFHYNIFDDKPPEDGDFDDVIHSDKKVQFESQPSSTFQSSNTSKVETSSKRPSDLFNNKINLFDDDDDDDIFEKLITPSSKKDVLKREEVNEISSASQIKSELIEENKETPVAQTKRPVNLFDPGRLFDDTPPSDDEQLFSSISTKKDTTKSKQIVAPKQSTGEFYNDFSETITSMPKSLESSSVEQAESTVVTDVITNVEKADVSPQKGVLEGGLFEDQMPKDEAEIVKSVSSDDGSSSEKRSNFLKKIDTFSNQSSSEQKADTKPIPKARQPKKLNIGNIEINVAALLPGAKHAKSVEKGDSKENPDDVNDGPSGSEVMSSVKAVSQGNVDSSGRLTNLNRGRVKNLSRRPSTRAGRKLQYKHSIESEEQTDGSSDQMVVPQPAPLKKVINEQIEENLEKPDIPSLSPPKTVSKPLLTKAIFEDDLFETDRPSNITENIKNTTNEVESSNPSEDIDVELRDDNVKKENPFSFLEDQEEENDDFMTVEPKTPTKITSTVSIKATPAYIDELPPELDPIDKLPSNKNDKGTSLLSQNALSLFGDEDEDFDNDDILNTDRSNNQSDLPSDVAKSEDDWSPYPSSYIQETPPASNEKRLPTSSALSLFDDELKIEATDQKQPVNIVPSTSITQETQSTSSGQKPPVSSVLGLFDDDLNDNELFGAQTSTESTESKTKTPSTSNAQYPSPSSSDKKLSASSALDLFDDKMGNNNIFNTKPSKESKVAVKPEKQPTKSVLAVSKLAKSSLFGDDDESDDLFGGPPPLPEPSKPSKKPTSKIFSDSSDDDDLFGGGKMNKKNLPKSSSFTTPTAPKAVNKSSDKLFSDSEDDDDDLFGTKSKPMESGSKKVTSAGTSKSVKEDPMKMVKTLSPSAVDNDPLADLLK